MEFMEDDDLDSVHENSAQDESVHTIPRVDDVAEKAKVPGDIHVFKKVEGKFDAPCHTTFLALLSFCHEEKTTKFVAPRVNWRQINKDFVKDLVDGAEKDCQSETSLDWKEEIIFTFYEVYHIAEAEEKDFDMNLYEPLYSSYKTNTVQDGAECIINKWAGSVRMFTLKKLINLLCIKEDFQDVFNMDEPIDSSNNALVTDPSLLARIIGHEVFKSLKFPTLDLFEKFPQLAIDPSSDMTLTMYNAAKNMRELIQKFQELTSLRVAFIDGQHRGFGTKIMCCGYHIGDASEKRVNYFHVQCYQIGPESPVTRLLGAKVVLDESGMVVKEQGAIESKRLDIRKKTGVPVTWRSWFSGHLESLYSQYLNAEEDYLRHLWRPAYLTKTIVRQCFLLKSGKFVFNTQILVFLLFLQGFKSYKEVQGEYYVRDGKLLARQEPCISYINAVLQTLSREEKPTSWKTWIDNEIDSKGIHATVHFPLPPGEKGRRLMPRELSTALWLLRYGISTAESFSTLYGLFGNNSYPKSYDQRIFDQDYLTSDFVNRFIIYPIGQIVSIVCAAAGDEKTKDLLTQHFVNKPKYTTLIGLFRDAVRTTLATSLLSALRQFGPDPLSKVFRVKNSLEIYTKTVTLDYKSSHKIKQHATKIQDVMGVLEAIIVSLPGYIERVYHDNVKQMFPRLKMSKSESRDPDTKLSDFELFIPMTDNITGVRSFDTLDTYFKSILSGTIDPPAYEHVNVKLSTETDEKPNKKTKVNKAGASTSDITQVATKERINAKKKVYK
jgi:hypothetical protein